MSGNEQLQISPPPNVEIDVYIEIDVAVDIEAGRTKCGDSPILLI